MTGTRRILVLVGLLFSIGVIALFCWASWFAEVEGVLRRPIPPREAEALENGDKFELFSLDPEMHGSYRQEQREVRRDDGGNWLHGRKILGSVDVQDQEERNEIRDYLKQAVERGSEVAYGCFVPRHAIRVIRGEQTVDFLICFQCNNGQVSTFEGDKLVGSSFLYLTGKRNKFDAILVKHGVAITKN